MAQAFSNNSNSIIVSSNLNYTAPDDDSKILAWLSPLEPWVRHRDIGAQRVDSVGDWLLETGGFRRWRTGSRENESNHAALFCDGNPGVGKSYIISLVIDRLCDEAIEEGTAVTCFYFDFASRNEQSPINMLGSLLRQLVTGLGGIPEAVVQRFRNEQKVIGGRGLQVSGILEMFRSIAATKRTFICVDALDECVPEHRLVVLESLGQVLRESPNTRIFMTGRPHVRTEVERRLDGVSAFILIHPTEAYFIRYLREKLKDDTTPDMMNATLEADMMKTIPEISSETFLLASLHIDAILRETTLARRRKRLQSLKDGAGLGDAFSATLERIKAQDGERTKLAIASLTWICHAERPLQVNELCQALAVEIGASDFDPENVPSIGAVLGCCQGLITVDKEASTVRLIHFTVQEYLCAQTDLFNKPHTMIAETCLTFLNSQQVRNLSPEPLPDHQNIPFLKYCSGYWGRHANQELSEHTRTLALKLLSRYNNHSSAMSLLKQQLSPAYDEFIGANPLFSGLHCASFFGIVELATELINETGCDINQRDCIGRTPLFWAALKGHEVMVANLLGREDVDPNCPDKRGITPLASAALRGDETVVKLLLERESVDPNRSGKTGFTPLICAAWVGHEGVVKALLEREGVDPNCPGRNGLTPLVFATVRGHKGVVKQLLERENVDPNRPENGNLPLVSTVTDGHGGVVMLLLEREIIDPDRIGVDAQELFTYAATNGYERVVKTLLEREDVDPNLPGESGAAPLACAACGGHEGVVELLLERENVDPNYPGTDGASPLVCASMNGHEGVVKMLLRRKDIDPNQPGMGGFTPLEYAVSNGHGRVVKLLLEREAVDPVAQKRTI